LKSSRRGFFGLLGGIAATKELMVAAETTPLKLPEVKLPPVEELARNYPASACYDCYAMLSGKQVEFHTHRVK
jgi:hypothetical protein